MRRTPLHGRRPRLRTSFLKLTSLENRDLPSGGFMTPSQDPFLGPLPYLPSDPATLDCIELVADPKLKATGPFFRPPSVPQLLTPPGGNPGVYSPDPITWTTAANGMPQLNSSPTSPVSIFLDFDGQGSNLPYDNDSPANPSVFSLAEQQTIVECWRQVAVYYAMYDVNVTTVQPNTSTTPTVWQLISPSISGGYAYVGAFPNTQPQGFNQSSDARTRISGIVHEIGHNFILSHQSDYDLLGVKTAEYSSGYSLHGPIMGVDYAQSVHKFINGHPSSSASSLQDDLQAIANEIKVYQPAGGDGYRADEHDGVIATATPMQVVDGYSRGWGIIERANDVDAFSFTTTGGLYALTGNPNTPGALDAVLEVYDGAGTRLATADSANNHQNLVMSLPAGTYYALISGHGDYADTGAYFVNVRPLPPGWSTTNIGTVTDGGYAGIDAATGIWRVAGGGSDIWGTSDNFRFASIPLTGNGTITARVLSLQNTDANAKVGVMMRDSNNSNAMNAFMLLKPGSAAFQYRTSNGGSTSQATSGATAPYWVRLTRSGSTVTGAVSADGLSWTNVGSATINFASSTILIGLAVTSHNTSQANVLNQASFDNVSTTGSTGPTAPSYNALPSPTGVALTLGTGTGINVSWDAVAGATGYLVERSADAVVWSTATTTSAATLAFSHTGLGGGVRHFYRVSARDGTTNSLPSSVLSIINRPSAVTNFEVTSLSTTQLVLDWRDTSGETGYRIERSTDGGTNWTTLANIGRNVPSYSNSGLATATAYTYRVIPTSPNGDGVASNVVTTSTRLNPVTGLAISAVSSTSVTFGWNAVGGATGYRIQRSTDGTNFTTLTTVATPGYVDGTVTPLNEYYYRVAAVNAYSESTTQPVAFTATPPSTALPAPWLNQDIGTVGGRGTAGLGGSTYTVIGSGAQVSGTSDSFHFAYQPMSGDGVLTARVAGIENTATAGRAGIMIRESTAANARMAFIGFSPVSATGMTWNYRPTPGGATTVAATTGITAPYWVRLTRTGNTFLAERSADNVTWSTVGSTTIAMSANALAGLAVTAGTNGLLNRTTVTDVSLVQANVPPRVIQSTPTGTGITAPVSNIDISFNQSMDTTSFNVAADVLSFSGPAGNLLGQIVGSNWVNGTTLRVVTSAQSVPGAYALTLGPQVLSAAGKALDQNNNGTPGEAADTYTAGFTIGRVADGFGYVYTGTAYDPQWVLTPGAAGVVSLTPLNSTDDANTPIDLSTNSFRFYGNEYSGAGELYVATNGLITFSSGTLDYTNLNLTATPTQRSIAVLWDDIITDRNSATDDIVLYKFVDLDTDGTPDRLVINWRNVHYYVQQPTSGDDGITFQAVLELNTGTRSGDVVLNYTDIAEVGVGAGNNGGAATVGIKDLGPQGANRVLVSQDGSGSAFIGSNKAVRLFINQAPTADVGGPYDLNASSTTGLSGIVSSDPDQTSVSLYYLWDLDGDGLFAEVGPAATRGDEFGATPTFMGQGLTGPANPAIALKVVDEFGLVSTDSGVVNVPGPVKVIGFVVADGSEQRSRVSQVSIQFDRPVVLPAFPTSGFTLNGPGGPVFLADATANQSVVTVTFAELSDGQYTFAINPSVVTDALGQPLDGDGDGTPGGAYSANFHRLFGDADGDADVDATDFGVFRTAFGSSNFLFDIDNDGDVDTADFGAFRVRYGVSL